MMDKETPAGTLLVTLILCIVCSVLVSFSAVALKPIQEKNKTRDMKKHLLMAARLITDDKVPDKTIDQAFQAIETRVVDLEKGRITESMDPSQLNPVQDARDPDLGKPIDPETDVAGIGRRARFAKIYLVREAGDLKQVIFPVYGQGLWSTMYGFVALGSDYNTIQGVTFYDHGETPGLGGEIENPTWKQLWQGKKIYGDEFQIRFDIAKGRVPANSPARDSQVDGISGATLTGNGVEHAIHYWFGSDGFLKWIQYEKERG